MRAPESAVDTAAGILVDFAALAQLADALIGLADQLALSGSPGGQLDDPDLTDAFLGLHRIWHKQYAALHTFLHGVASSVVASLSLYRQLETELGRAASAAGGARRGPEALP
jgi:hypothetical protein